MSQSLFVLLWLAAPATGQPVTEVVVVGTQHASHLWNTTYSPTHLRALLSKIGPDALGIENLPNWQQAGVQFHPGLAESVVALSWAEEHKIPVFGVKVDSLAGWEQSARSFRERMSSQSDEVLRRQFWSSVANQAAQLYGSPATLESVHGPEGIQRQLASRQQYSERQRAMLVSLDQALAERVLETIRARRPRRMAIVHGADHLGPLIQMLSGKSEVRVVGVPTFLPLTAVELDNAWRPEDSGLVLGHVLDGSIGRAAPQARDLARAKRELDRLNQARPSSPAALYYRARWNMLQFGYAEAQRLLSQVRQDGEAAGRELPIASEVRWPPFTTYRALATYSLANLEDLQGRHQDAVPLYEELLQAVRENPMPRTAEVQYFDLSGYLQNLIELPYAGGVEEFLRGMKYRRYLLWAEAPELIRKLALEAGGR